MKILFVGDVMLGRTVNAILLMIMPLMKLKEMTSPLFLLMIDLCKNLHTQVVWNSTDKFLEIDFRHEENILV